MNILTLPLKESREQWRRGLVRRHLGSWSSPHLSAYETFLQAGKGRSLLDCSVMWGREILRKMQWAVGAPGGRGPEWTLESGGLGLNLAAVLHRLWKLHVDKFMTCCVSVFLFVEGQQSSLLCRAVVKTDELIHEICKGRAWHIGSAICASYLKKPLNRFSSI